ncbi:ABC transporter2C ATP-binding protein [gamma proteobacterium IMCC2047]|nr:ABC transporter2C ATP-binding protein [gamma proteobacterium IMCC2047]
MKFKVLWLFLLAPLLAFSTVSYAEDEDADAESLEDVRYLDIKPAVVTNYGGVGRMSYIKAEVSLQVGSQEDFQKVFHHFPSLRHSLVMLLGQQTDATIAAGAPREALRQQVLAQMRAIMEEEEEGGADMIDDVLFSAFFVQR